MLPIAARKTVEFAVNWGSRDKDGKSFSATKVKLGMYRLLWKIVAGSALAYAAATRWHRGVRTQAQIHRQERSFLHTWHNYEDGADDRNLENAHSPRDYLEITSCLSCLTKRPLQPSALPCDSTAQDAWIISFPPRGVISLTDQEVEGITVLRAGPMRCFVILAGPMRFLKQNAATQQRM